MKTFMYGLVGMAAMAGAFKLVVFGMPVIFWGAMGLVCYLIGRMVETIIAEVLNK